MGARAAGIRPRLARSRVLMVLAAVTAGLGAPAPASATSRPAVELQILSVSDWHGQLDPLSVPGVGDVGGAAVLSSYWRAERTANPNTLTLTAGDAFGASPPLSSFFDEEPAVKAMNLMGFDADTFGNHNFDRGIAHLQHMIDLAEFDYLSANLANRDANLAGVEDFKIFDVGGVKVAVIGVTNPEAPGLVIPGAFGTIEVTDPVPAANRARAAARQRGATVFVAITHLGVDRIDPVTGQPAGPLVDFASNVGGFDVILGDHTDVQYEAVINNALVVENRSKGATYARMRLRVDPHNGRVLERSNRFVTPVVAGIVPDPEIVDLLAPYRTALARARDGKIGEAAGVFPRNGTLERTGEAAIGNLVADSMRLRYGTQLAFVNGGGIRTPLPSSYSPQDRSLRRPSTGYAPGPPWDLVVGDAYAVLPFGSAVVTRDITGSLLHAVLEHSVAAIPATSGRFLQISGFRFAYDAARPAGSRVVSVALADGTPIAADSTIYSVATNSFVNAGGDGYTMLLGGSGVTREIDAHVLREHIAAAQTVTPALDGRITRRN